MIARAADEESFDSRVTTCQAGLVRDEPRWDRGSGLGRWLSGFEGGREAAGEGGRQCKAFVRFRSIPFDSVRFRSICSIPFDLFDLFDSVRSVRFRLTHEGD